MGKNKKNNTKEKSQKSGKNNKDNRKEKLKRKESKGEKEDIKPKKLKKEKNNIDENGKDNEEYTNTKKSKKNNESDESNREENMKEVNDNNVPKIKEIKIKVKLTIEVLEGNSVSFCADYINDKIGEALDKEDDVVFLSGYTTNNNGAKKYESMRLIKGEQIIAKYVRNMMSEAMGDENNKRLRYQNNKLTLSFVNGSGELILHNLKKNLMKKIEDDLLKDVRKWKKEAEDKQKIKKKSKSKKSTDSDTE